MDGRHAGPNLGSPTSPDDIPPQFLGCLPGRRQDHESFQGGALLQTTDRCGRQCCGFPGSRPPKHHPDSLMRPGGHLLLGVQHWPARQSTGQEAPGSDVVHESMEACLTPNLWKSDPLGPPQGAVEQFLQENNYGSGNRQMVQPRQGFRFHRC